MNNHNQQTTANDYITLSYDVSFEPMNIHNHSQELLNISMTIRDLFTDNPTKCLQELLILVEKHPNDPIFAGYLANAYILTKNKDMAEKTIISNYKKYPYYLFARCAYAELCLKVGKIKDAAKAINNVYNLKQMYPERSMFHYTEVITLNAFCTKYYCELGDSEQAEIHFKMIKDIDDEHPIIAQLENYIFASFLKKLVQKH